MSRHRPQARQAAVVAPNMHSIYTTTDCGDSGGWGDKMFAPEEKKRIGEALTQKLGNDKLSSRRGPGGSKVTYVEGWQATELANEVFGYDGWRSKIMSLHLDSMDRGQNGNYECCYSAVVRIQVRAEICAGADFCVVFLHIHPSSFHFFRAFLAEGRNVSRGHRCRNCRTEAQRHVHAKSNEGSRHRRTKEGVEKFRVREDNDLSTRLMHSTYLDFLCGYGGMGLATSRWILFCPLSYLCSGICCGVCTPICSCGCSCGPKQLTWYGGFFFFDGATPF